MRHIKYLIIGGGPSGLTLAHSLIDSGALRSEIVVLEKNPTAGGLCRSEMVDGSPLDIGGGHFLDVKHRDVLDFLFRFMPEAEWQRHNRVSKIHLNDQMVDHPLESNLWQFNTATQIDYLEAIARAGCTRDTPMPESFAAWVTWKFGDKIANDYMLPYNRKIWSMDPDALGTYWLHKLPNVSFRETLQSCLENKPFGALPAHGVFLYPKKHGYGEVWQRMGTALGSSLITNTQIQSIDPDNRIVITNHDQWQANHIYNSAPWTDWPEYVINLPVDVTAAILNLQHVSIDIDYVPEPLNTPAHWIYEPDETLNHHRKLVRSNFCTDSHGYWTETNSRRSAPTTGWRHTNKYAYPVNTLGKPETVATILTWAAAHGITGFGRWGTWDHMNSDIAVKQALELGKLAAW